MCKIPLPCVFFFTVALGVEKLVSALDSYFRESWFSVVCRFETGIFLRRRIGSPGALCLYLSKSQPPSSVSLTSQPTDGGGRGVPLFTSAAGGTNRCRSRPRRDLDAVG